MHLITDWHALFKRLQLKKSSRKIKSNDIHQLVRFLYHVNVSVHVCLCCCRNPKCIYRTCTCLHLTLAHIVSTTPPVPTRNSQRPSVPHYTCMCVHNTLARSHQLSGTGGLEVLVGTIIVVPFFTSWYRVVSLGLVQSDRQY